MALTSQTSVPVNHRINPPDAQPANRPEDGAREKGTDGKPALEAAQPKESAAAASAAVHQVGQSPEPRPVLPAPEQPGTNRRTSTAGTSQRTITTRRRRKPSD